MSTMGVGGHECTMEQEPGGLRRQTHNKLKSSQSFPNAATTKCTLCSMSPVMKWRVNDFTLGGAVA